MAKEKEAKLPEVEKAEAKDFKINFKLADDKVFTFSGPKGYSWGVLYYTCHEILSHISQELVKYTESIAPKDADESDKVSDNPVVVLPPEEKAK